MLGFVSADVLQLLFNVLFDEGVVRKEVFLRWASAAALRGKDEAVSSACSFFSRLREPESSSSPPTLSEETSLCSKRSRTAAAQASKHRAHSL